MSAHRSHRGGPKWDKPLPLTGHEDGFVSVALSAGYVTAFRFQARDDTWERLGNATVPAIALRSRTKFHVGVRDGRLSVRIDDAPVLEVAVRAYDMSGAWGLGVQAGGAGRWRGVTLQK